MGNTCASRLSIRKKNSFEDECGPCYKPRTYDCSAMEQRMWQSKKDQLAGRRTQIREISSETGL